MDEADGRADVGPQAAGQGDGDRIDALEQQVRQLTSRLAGWLETQLVQAVDDRRKDMKTFRSELQLVLNEQLAGMRAEANSVLTVATRRLEVGQEQLGERLDRVAEQAADFARQALALGAASSADGDRFGVLEQQVGQSVANVVEQMKVELANARERQRAELGALREEISSRLAPLDGVAVATEAMDQRLRSAESGLNESVEARLQEAAEARRTELDALTEDIAALKTEGSAGPARIEAFEQRVKAAMGRLTDSVETRLGETAVTRENGLGALRLELTEAMRHQVASAVAVQSDSVDARLAELATVRAAEIEGLRADLAATIATLGERVDATGRHTAVVADSVNELRSGAEAAIARADELEQRVKAAVGRLAESVESRLAELAAGHSSELREGIDIVATALRARLAEVQERVQEVEQHGREADGRVGEVVEARLGEIVERRRAELDALKVELEAALATQLSEARSEIGTAVAEAHRRFVVAVDKLHDRMNVVTDQSTAAHAAATKIGTLEETLTSDGRRIEALEVHTRRTDARLGEVVEAKLSEQRAAELGGVQEQVRAALDAHLAETRAEVTLALGQGRQELIDGATRLVERQEALDRQAADAASRLEDRQDALERQAAEAASRLEDRQDALERQAADAAAGLEAIDASVETGLREAELRLRQTVDARLAAFDGVAAQLAEDRAELALTSASLARKVARVQDQVQKRVATVVEQLAGLARAAAVEAGTLAPLRSDLRLLQAQVAELSELVTAARPARKAATPAKKAPARQAPAAPPGKAVVIRKSPAAPARKAPARKAVAKKAVAKKAVAPAAKVSRPRRPQ